jgi:hypothetical protein
LDGSGHKRILVGEKKWRKPNLSFNYPGRSIIFTHNSLPLDDATATLQGHAAASKNADFIPLQARTVWAIRWDCVFGTAKRHKCHAPACW